MALPTLNWRRLAPVAIATNDVAGALNALYAAGTAATYADGSARVPGTGSAWTWSIDTTNALQPGVTTAAYATPPTVTALNQRVIWCGSANAPTAMALFPSETRSAGIMYCSVVKNAGAYSDWNTATPFVGGNCLGFARAGVAAVTATWTTLNLWESQEAVAVQLSRVAPNSTTSASISGAFMDPCATANGEADGRLYGMMTSGANNYCAQTFWSATTDTLFYDTGVAGNARFGAFTPGGTTVDLYRRLINFSVNSLFLSRGGEVPFVPAYAALSTGTFPALFREMYVTRDAFSNLTLQTGGGTPLGYSLGANYRTTEADVCLLKY